MKIDAIDVMYVHLDAPEEPGCHPVFCRIYADDGTYGDGEAAMLLMSGARAAHGMLRELAPMLIGRDPLASEAIWNLLYRRSYFAQNGGPTMYAAISALDMALWDIKGKRFGVPVYALLGGAQRDAVRCYASQIHSGWGPAPRRANTPEQFAQNARLAAAEGFDAVKFDCFVTDEEGRPFTEAERTGLLDAARLDLIERRVAAVREALGPGPDILIEGHGFTEVTTALQIAKRIEKYDILFYEEPCTPFLPAAKRFAELSGIAPCGGERLFTRWQYLPYMQAGAYRLLQPDVGDCGGITEAKKIIDLADVYELPVQMHCCASPLSVAATLQLEAAMNRFTFHEHASFQNQPCIRKLCVHDIMPSGGRMRVPERPGLGNELSEFALTHCEKFTVR